MPFYPVLLLLSGLLPVSPVSLAASSPIASVTLHHQPAEELLPVLQPLLEAGEVILPGGSELLIQASPARAALLREWIVKLDKPRHRLRISIMQADQPPDEGFDRHVYRLPPRRQRAAVIEVQTLDGKPALFRSLEPDTRPARPLPGFYPPVPLQPTGTPPSQGFQVTPRLLGDQVVIEVEPVSTRSAYARTTLRVAAGTWARLGGEADRPSVGYGDGTVRHYATPSREQSLYLKVDDLDADLP
ncbi:MAG: hypothetical protein RLZZ226_1413 [Pseudomonadota bacterium]|jgi:hypothetical protein